MKLVRFDQDPFSTELDEFTAKHEYFALFGSVDYSPTLDQLANASNFEHYCMSHYGLAGESSTEYWETLAKYHSVDRDLFDLASTTLLALDLSTQVG